MKKQLLYVVALCSSFSLCAKVNESLSLPNLTMQFMFSQALLMVRQLQDLACSTQATLEQVKEEIKRQIAPLLEISDEDTMENYMLHQTYEVTKAAVAAVADATRKNELPAVDSQMFKKGVDAQATRLKVIEYLESLLK